MLTKLKRSRYFATLQCWWLISCLLAAAVSHQKQYYLQTVGTHVTYCNLSNSIYFQWAIICYYRFMFWDPVLREARFTNQQQSNCRFVQLWETPKNVSSTHIKFLDGITSWFALINWIWNIMSLQLSTSEVFFRQLDEPHHLNCKAIGYRAVRTHTPGGWDLRDTKKLLVM